VHVPVDDGVVTVIVRAATVVLDFFDAVPVTEMQSPAVTELTASVTVLENWVVVVHPTVVCPVLAFCTSMVEPLSAATLPDAPVGWFVAAPAGAAAIATTTRAVTPPPTSCAQRLRFARWPVGVCISIVPLSLTLLRSEKCTVDSYSLRRASIGASAAARLAG
jgi:hypothetical protein